MGTYKREYATVVDTLLTECDIYAEDGHCFHADKAMWDTGADTTVVSSRVVRHLHLRPCQKGNIIGIGGANDTDFYLVHIKLPTNVFLVNLEVVETGFEDYDIILGMDIITETDFLITNAEGRTTFQFRTPTVGGVEL